MIEPSFPQDPDDEDDEGPIGIFPSWRAAYASVVIVTLLMIALLYWFTVALDFSAT